MTIIRKILALPFVAIVLITFTARLSKQGIPTSEWTSYVQRLTKLIETVQPTAKYLSKRQKLALVNQLIDKVLSR